VSLPAEQADVVITLKDSAREHECSSKLSQENTTRGARLPRCSFEIEFWQEQGDEAIFAAGSGPESEAQPRGSRNAKKTERCSSSRSTTLKATFGQIKKAKLGNR
jgi:hypothetical protein